MTRSALLLLADSRFPAGAHAHSGGLESAVAAGRVHDTATLHAFLTGRLHTAALVAASFAAAACHCENAETLAELDHEYDIRLLSPALRTASRRLGKQLLRTARTTWPVPRLNLLAATPDGGSHHPVVLGVVCAAAGIAPEDAALCAVQGAITVPADAAIRLLGLDPGEVSGVLAKLAPPADRTASKALTLARMAQLKNDFSMLPALGSPLLDLAAEDHATWEARLYAS
ncbi:urease accessory protein UreF [Actinospica sp. MGRD01-02]|uniref:Urease accessory protein UreF n=1 Tax=Actinospica acidithermotolerans TaxID=2828514 RepID=A0A941EI78_9ACTN|nr:urease accessory UreF family protein [Actinospica acidithermotolerans]MBR7829569.1 urease accessory protein UreF [Actinospica acidithermotolerans]